MPPSPTSFDGPLDALWRAPVIVWTMLAGEGLALILALAPGAESDRWIYFGLTSLMVQWVSLLTLGTLYLFRGSLARTRPQFIAYFALVLLVCMTSLVSGISWLLLRGLWSMTQDGWQALFLRFNGIALTVGIFGLAAFQNHFRVRQLAVLAKQSELEALQARIRPHFLFNTLNTGVALVHQRPEEVENLLLDLADLFRAALAGPQQIMLEEELDLARRYLEIEALRFGERLSVLWELPSVMPAIAVPALSVQPLVENAIRHGIEQLPAGGQVEVVVSTTSDTVVIRITNPLPQSVPHVPRGHHVGLNATQARIEALTDGRGSVHTQMSGGFYIATVRLPIRA